MTMLKEGVMTLDDRVRLQLAFLNSDLAWWYSNCLTYTKATNEEFITQAWHYGFRWLWTTNGVKLDVNLVNSDLLKDIAATRYLPFQVVGKRSGSKGAKSE